MPDSNRYYQKFEYMFVLSKGKPKTFNPIKDHKNTAKRWSKTFNVYNADGTMTEKNRDLEVNEFGVRFNIWKYNTGFSQSTNDKIAHPAIFPEKLANDHIISWSNKKDLVLDPFMGSGTTAKMALLNNRDFIGFDISEEYCELANNRIESLLNQTNIFDYIGD
jgi:site-specific DNA-methyltransferase (adenine-specific)